jgi:hypothetical protein
MVCEGGRLVELTQCCLPRKVLVLVAFEASSFAADVT